MIPAFVLLLLAWTSGRSPPQRALAVSKRSFLHKALRRKTQSDFYWFWVCEGVEIDGLLQEASAQSTLQDFKEQASNNPVCTHQGCDPDDCRFKHGECVPNAGNCLYTRVPMQAAVGVSAATASQCHPGNAQKRPYQATTSFRTAR
ncbi:unnamed protein product [Symbiodinium sp. CCMP2456]|nr:unnamed protein product [Symbiodinium sp. CCMP2456]